MPTKTQSTSFMGSLFDFTFSEFITTKLVRVIYFLGLVAVGIGALAILSGGFSQGFFAGVLSIFLAALVFLLGAMYLRVVLEVLIVVFRIAEDVAKIADRGSTRES